MSAFGGIADIEFEGRYVCFSNRPIGVKRFQAIHHCGLDVARGLCLLYGLGARALPSWDPRTRWNNLLSDLSVKRTVGPSRHTLPETKALGGGGFRRPLAFNVRVRVRDQCALPRRLDDLQSRSNSP